MSKKIKDYQDKISARFKSAANLIHLIVYEPDSFEVIYSYSSPGISLSTYLINIILETITLDEGVKVENQEIHLRDGGYLILNDGEYTRVAVIARELPSVEMQKHLMCFQGELEHKLEVELIPELGPDLLRITRLKKLAFAKELIERCFEKSLTFEHTVIEIKDPPKLKKLERNILEIARKIKSKSGSFYLRRLVARAQTELSPNLTMVEILEAVYNLKKIKYLQPVTQDQARKIKEKLYRSADEEKKEGKKERKKGDRV